MNTNGHTLKGEIVSYEGAAMPIMTADDAAGRFQQIVEFTHKVMRPDVDYGVIPGTEKRTLLKPGAEKLTTLFGLTATFEVIERVQDWTGQEHGGEMFFYFWYRCSLYHGEQLVAQGDGSCNSWEKKYRYRTTDRVCPECGAATIKRSKPQYGGGWYCFAKIGGCGANFPKGDPEIEEQQGGQVANPDIADQVNTIQKMAKKRSLVDAVLLAVNASEFFTQDMEDFVSAPDTSYLVAALKSARDTLQTLGAPLPSLTLAEVKAMSPALLQEAIEEMHAALLETVAMHGVKDEQEAVPAA